MIRYQIPPHFLPSFRSLAAISDDQVTQLVAFLNELPLGLGPKSFRAHFKEKQNQDGAFAPDTGSMLFSLGGFKEIPENTLQEQADALAESIKEQGEGMTAEETARLKQILEQLLAASANMQATYKAFVLLSQNERVVRESHILTDLRLVFDKKLENKDRHGVVIHQLRMTSEVDSSQKDFFFNLTLADLNNLQEQISRAIEKERLITEDYAGTINIIKIRE